jgi:hypothetical protein
VGDDYRRGPLAGDDFGAEVFFGTGAHWQLPR